MLLKLDFLKTKNFAKIQSLMQDFSNGEMQETLESKIVGGKKTCTSFRWHNSNLVPTNKRKRKECGFIQIFFAA